MTLPRNTLAIAEQWEKNKIRNKFELENSDIDRTFKTYLAFILKRQS